MPKRKYSKFSKKYKRPYKKFKRSSKKYWRRKKNSAKSVVRIKSPRIFPDGVIVKLPYHDAQDLDISSATNNYWQYSGNSLYDPDVTGIGHKPRGFTQWGAFFNHYYVKASSITARFYTQSGPGSVMNFTVYPSNSATFVPTSGNVWELPEQPYARTRYVSAQANNPMVNQHVKHFMSTAKITGKKKPSIDEDFQAVTNANPVRRWYWYVVIASLGGNNISETGQIVVDIMYDVYFFNRGEVTPS